MKIKLISSLTVAVIGTSVFSATAPASAYDIKSIDTDTTGFKDIIEEFQQFVSPSGVPFSNPTAYKLDLTKLKLGTDYNPRVYFLNEGAGFRNQLGFTATNGSTFQSGLIFEDASCGINNTECQGAANDGPLDIGDYVDLGNFSAGTLFNFWLKADGYNGGTYVYGADPASNPDGLEHLVAYEYKGHLVIGFEDLYGPLGATEPPNQNSDRDFEDTVFVVKFPGLEKARKNVPEPSSVLSILGVGAFGVSSLHKRKQQQKSQDSSLS
ncbi:DUF4114 domain-containing protein [Coleofasciculus sp. H7-2]|uniref:DUF4114 domain-containing protein n=1 Tax=Coleofasciculus sp. H7-2 TaxID=3351545 RepID=UPI00366C0719